MTLISLNTWTGRAGKDKLLDFFKRNKEVDIFCLQEVWQGGYEHADIWGGGHDTNQIENISRVLTDHTHLFYSHYMDWYGLAIFIKKDIEVLEEGDVFVHKTREDKFEDDNMENHARNIQYI